MGLRFRRSVKICKGVKLNFGKTGASISLGGNGFRKTFHTSGKVTTSVGIPGTGVYWTETTNRKNNTISPRTRNNEIDNRDTYVDYSENEFNWNDITSDTIDTRHDDFSDLINDESEEMPYNTQNDSNSNNENNLDNEENYIDLSELLAQARALSNKSDIFIDWSEIEFSNSSDEVLLDEDIWLFCKQKANDVLNGDIDAYLDVIEFMKPLDDLAIYAGDFEFGTDNPTEMNVEFTVLIDNGDCTLNDNVFMEYISTISFKVAKDIFSLLPISNVHIQVIYRKEEVFNLTLNRSRC